MPGPLGLTDAARTLRRNVVANYAGQGWRALMGIAFVPWYIHLLGIEVFGLIGAFTILQAWLNLLDLGMKPTLGRELARLSGGDQDAQAIRDLLRTVEVVTLALALALALGVWALADWLAASWLRSDTLAPGAVARAIAVMGAVTGLRFVEDVYVFSLSGLQRQALQNVITSVMATARGLGAVALLAWVSPTIEAFFLWQGAVSLVGVVVCAAAVYRVLPAAPRPAAPSVAALKGIWQFAAGMLAITLLSLLLTQVDKMLLSRLLPLEEFGRYTFAGVLSGALANLVGPITAAYYPRLVELIPRRDEAALAAAYHQGAQLVSVCMGAAAVALVVFAERLIALWTNDPELARGVAPLVQILTLGTLANCLIWMPYQLQLAHGWTALTIQINVVAVALVIPAIVLVVPAHGALGAAWVWTALNSSYVIFGIPLMHRRLLRAEAWRWYGRDVALPLGGAAVMALLLRWLAPRDLDRPAELVTLTASAALVLLAAALAAPIVRAWLIRLEPDRPVS